jgi:hypothetical protein
MIEDEEDEEQTLPASRPFAIWCLCYVQRWTSLKRNRRSAARPCVFKREPSSLGRKEHCRGRMPCREIPDIGSKMCKVSVWDKGKQHYEQWNEAAIATTQKNRRVGVRRRSATCVHPSLRDRFAVHGASCFSLSYGPNLHTAHTSHCLARPAPDRHPAVERPALHREEHQRTSRP